MPKADEWHLSEIYQAYKKRLDGQSFILSFSKYFNFLLSLQSKLSGDILLMKVVEKNGQSIQLDFNSPIEAQQIFKKLNRDLANLKWRVHHQKIEGVCKINIRSKKNEEFLRQQFISQVFQQLRDSVPIIESILVLDSKILTPLSQKLKRRRNIMESESTIRELQMKKKIMEIANEKNECKKNEIQQERKQGTNVYKIHSIERYTEKHDDKNEKKVATGGVSQVQKVCFKKLVICKEGQKKVMRNVVLAKKIKKQSSGKTSDEEQMKNKCQAVDEMNNRFTQELKVIRKINREGGKKDYLLDYFYEQDKQRQEYYLEYSDMNLSEYLYYYGENLRYSEIIDICQQIVNIVKDLHTLGIVHRDLKPTNFMVIQRPNQAIPVLKLIDFSDSYVPDQQNIDICATIPYSPLQCSRNSLLHESHGLKNKQIDYWSVGMMIYEVFYGYIPCSYSSAFSRDIQHLWKNQFLYYPFRRRKSTESWRAIEYGINVLRLKLVVINPGERIDLNKTSRILSILKNYLEGTNKSSFSKGLNNSAGSLNFGSKPAPNKSENSETFLKTLTPNFFIDKIL